MNTDYYFAYGSNMLDKVISSRRSIKVIGWEKCILHGFKIAFNCPGVNKYEPAFANIIKDEKEAVHGVLYKLSSEEFEGLVRTEGEMYSVEEIEVTLSSGNVTSAKTLVSTQTISETTPSLRYLELLIDGSVEKSLDKSYIEKLERVEHAPTPFGYQFVCKLVSVYLRVKFGLQKRND